MRGSTCISRVSSTYQLRKSSFARIELGSGAGYDPLAAVICGQLRAGLPKSRQQQLRHYCRPCPAMSDNIAQILNAAERVDGDGDDTGVNSTQEGDRPIVGIAGDQQHALFEAQPQFDQRIGELSDAEGELLKR